LQRTLNRRLAEEGVTLTQVVAGVRMSFAETLLLSTQIPINDIASCVGFAEAPNFSRAFKRARSLTPKALHETHH
jgi:transcriptional regulator GlxA family with amidase domain